MIRDTALSFWLQYLEHEGALCETKGDTAQVLLPPALQQTLRLPETLTVTSDPEVAEDEAALLLIAGHPALEAAATHVLARGDVGRGFLAWPSSRAPSLGLLVAQAREQIGVDHGRIDAARDPAPVYHPLLRVTALATYTLEDCFQEREDVLVDARAAVRAPDDAGWRAASEAIFAAPDTRHPSLPFDLVRAVHAAHAALLERTRLRANALERQAQSGLRGELARAEAFFEAALTSLANRRINAEPRRQSMLDAQAEATQHERRRRLREIELKFRAARELRPFRLHLLLVPAFALPVIVCRGERRYALTLSWLLRPGRFGNVRCPNCEAIAPLVAGRTHLGCRTCLPQAS